MREQRATRAEEGAVVAGAAALIQDGGPPPAGCQGGTGGEGDVERRRGRAPSATEEGATAEVDDSVDDSVLRWMSLRFRERGETSPTGKVEYTSLKRDRENCDATATMRKSKKRRAKTDDAELRASQPLENAAMQQTCATEEDDCTQKCEKRKANENDAEPKDVSETNQAARSVKDAATQATFAESPPDDDDLLPPKVTVGRNNHSTEFGILRSCMCPNPAVCRSLVLRWLRLSEGKYLHFQNLPGHKSRSETPVARHCNAYRMATLRALGYPTDGSPLVRMTNMGKREVTIQDKIFSERVSIVHFHPEVRPFVVQARELSNDKRDRWRVPLALGEKIGLTGEDECPTLGSDGERAFFAVPSYPIERATADVERAEEEYRRGVWDFRAANTTLLMEMATRPDRYARRMMELERKNERLVRENKELRERERKDLAERRAAGHERERLERGLEQLARRMNLFEEMHNTGGTDGDARVIYKRATGKDLDEDGHFAAKPGLRTEGGWDRSWAGGGRSWLDPRLERAAQVRWEDPALSIEEALRIGGFDYPAMEKGMKESETFDSGGEVTLAQRKQVLRGLLVRKKRRLAKRADDDPDAAREYAERYPKVEPPPEGVYAGLDLRDVPDQPLVHSAANRSGYRGVKPSDCGKFEVVMGGGFNGKNKCLGTFNTAEEAAGIYAKAKYYLKQHGIPHEWSAPAKDFTGGAAAGGGANDAAPNDNDDYGSHHNNSDDSESAGKMKDETGYYETV